MTTDSTPTLRAKHGNGPLAALLGVLLAFFCAVADAPQPAQATTSGVTARQIVYGPKVFRKDEGKPVILTDTFAVDRPVAGCLLIVDYGSGPREHKHDTPRRHGRDDDDDDQDRRQSCEPVSRAAIDLNDERVLRVRDFARDRKPLERPVEVRPENSLKVWLLGKPEGCLRLRIVCEDDGNEPPQADAGPDQTAYVGDTVTLDGSASTDLDGDPLTYAWSFVPPLPDGSTAVLLDADTVNPHFTVDAYGDYRIQLVVNDGTADSAPDTVTVSTLNSPPVADAGPDQTAHVGDTVTLDGSGSSDVDGQALTYLWELRPPSGSGATLDDPTAVMPHLVIDLPGTYLGSLKVNDGILDSAPDTVTVTTESSVPVADAGPDQTVYVGDTVTLDGSASSDLDGDPLSYLWSLSVPLGSDATLDDPSAISPHFDVDLPGTYVGQLIVNDGQVSSDPDTVSISTLNSRPVACITAPATALLGEAVSLDGTCSNDADGDLLGFTWSLPTSPTGSSPDLSGIYSDSATLVPDLPGLYIAQLIVDDGVLASDPVTATITAELPPPVNQSPEITSTPVTEATVGQPYSYDVEATDPDGDPLSFSLTVSPAGMSIDAASGLVQWTPTDADLAVSPVAVTVQVVDGQGGSDVQSFAISVGSGAVQPTVPAVVGLTKAEAMDLILAARLSLGTFTYVYDAVAPDGQVLDQAPAAGALVDLGAAVDLTVSLGPDEGLPPNPETVAPPLDPTVTTTLADATEFLYTGDNPVQTGVEPGTIEDKRVAVIRGKVFDRANNPLPGVTVTILDHPELGETLSRVDGAFDLAVNGGDVLTLVYEKAGYLPAQRQVETPWQDYAFAPDVSLVTLDPLVTAVDLTVPTGIQVARGSATTDADGTRQATLLFPAGTTAEMVLPDGNTQPLTTLNVRATEYTIGPDGPKAMPAQLPPTSGYTYAVEITADEALSAGATSVVLSQPVPFYVENFLGFPVGTAVPAGWYDRVKGQWIAAPNGRVIQVVGINGELADLDIDGDGSADAAAELEMLGITGAERERLAGLYAPGQSLWRVPLEHFTPWDLNWPYGPPPGAEPPTGARAERDTTDPKTPECKESGSAIGCETQTLGEAVAIGGTPFSLHYQSQRTPGYAVGRSLKVDLTDGDLPPGLKRVKLTISVAGKRVEQTFAPAPNQRFAWTWDGLDAFGRAVVGKQTATVRVSYDYDLVYYAAPAEWLQSFALASGRPTTITRVGYYEVGLAQTSNVELRGGSADGEAVAGWSLSTQHQWDAVRGVLMRGDGTETRANTFGPGISTVAGNGILGFSGDGGPATAASLSYPYGVAVAADGSLYIADYWNHRIRRVGPDGIIATVAGNGEFGFSGDGVPATATRLYYPGGIAVASDGSLYIADMGNHRIRRVASDGLIATVAGNGASGFAGDGELATAARLSSPQGVAVAADGSLYIADTANHRVRRLGPDGIITTVAGDGTARFSGDGGPATLAGLNHPWGVTVAADGSLYIGDPYDFRVRRVGSDGIITTAAGNGANGFTGDGGPATAASLYYPYGVDVSVDGSLYIADSGNHRIRRVGADGLIATVAGNGGIGFAGDGWPATAALLSSPHGVAFAADGSLYVADEGNQRIRRIASGPSGSLFFVSSPDGSEVYAFDSAGRHFRTLDALTSGTLYAFGYDTEGRLISVTDGAGNITAIERNGAGEPTAIVSPYGQRTELTLDANGYLASIANPAGETYRMEYTDDGLLARFEDPRGNASTLTYDDLGRLAKDANAAGGSQNLAPVKLEDPPGTEVTVTTAEAVPTKYKVEDLPIGEQRRTVTQPDGTASVSVTGTDGKTTSTASDGTVSTLTRGPDPRFGMSAPVTSQTVKTPGGRTATIANARTVNMTDPSDPLSLAILTDQLTINGRTSTSVYDAATRTTTSTSAAARVSTTQIDALGRPVLTQTAGLEPVAYAYDARGRLETVTQGAAPDARTVTFAYDAEGYLAGITDALDRSAGFAYDAAGRVTAQTFPDGRQVLFGYDAKGNLIGLTPPGRPEHAFGYTPVDLTAEYVPPDVAAGTNSTQYSYNLDKQLTRVLRPDGEAVDLAYDTAGRLATLTVPEGDFTYGYHATTGNLSRITAPDGGTLDFSYDGSLLTGAAWAGDIAGSVGFAYDNDFRVSSVTVNGANPVAYIYDPDSLLTQAGSLTLARNAQNGLLTGSTLGTVADQWDYNGFGEPDGYTATQGGAPLLDIDYTRDKLGRITEKTETVGGTTTTYAYGYDLAGRLVEVKKDGLVQTTWAYDDNGNRTQVNGAVIAQYDDQDRLTDYAGATYAYTANGELQTKTEGLNVTRYDYDVLGNLRQVVLPNGTRIDYLTDGRNRRIGKRINDILVQGFLYQDQLKPVAELDGAGNVVSRFVYATRVNVPDYMVKGGVTYRIVTDHLGSPRLVVNSVSGAVVQRMDYDAWGNVLLDTNPGFQPFGFAGGLYDRDTKLVRFGARDYDAGVGRWLVKDAVLFEVVELNRYLYAMADPLNLVDAQGYAGTGASNDQGVEASTGTAKCSTLGGDIQRRNKEVIWLFIKNVLGNIAVNLAKEATNPVGVPGDPIDRAQDKALEYANEKSGGKLDPLDPNKVREKLDDLSRRNALQNLMDLECSTCTASGY